MNCFNCQACNCNLVTEEKTEVILYPQSSLANIKTSIMKDKRIFVVNRTYRQTSDAQIVNNSKSHDNDSNFNDENNFNSLNDKIKADTIDTISKVGSLSSAQFAHSNASHILINEEKHYDSKLFSSKRENGKENSVNVNVFIEERKKVRKSSIQTKYQQSFRGLNLQRSIVSVKTAKNMGTNTRRSSRNSKREKRLQNFIPNINFSVMSPGSLGQSMTCDRKMRESSSMERENDKLKEQLWRLKEEQKELLKEQERMKKKSNRELNHLKRKSEDMQVRSTQRKKQLDQLKQILQILGKQNIKCDE